MYDLIFLVKLSYCSSTESSQYINIHDVIILPNQPNQIGELQQQHIVRMIPGKKNAIFTYMYSYSQINNNVQCYHSCIYVLQDMIPYDWTIEHKLPVTKRKKKLILVRTLSFMICGGSLLKVCKHATEQMKKATQPKCSSLGLDFNQFGAETMLLTNAFSSTVGIYRLPKQSIAPKI